ncbi:MAG: peroxiredoxin [Candidatus Chromulinivorax sp.]|nr:peroxiredoxin [Candidatus Chromulinivorax sp.]
MNVKFLMSLLLISLSAIAYAKSKTSLSQKLVHKSAPKFKAQAVFPDGVVDDLNLDDYAGQNIVLYFYPMDNSPGCTIQAKKFRDEIGRLNSKGITVIGVSKDSIRSHKKFQKALALPFPLISDTDGKNSIAKKYKAERFLIGKRITFLIDKNGIIFKVFDHVDIKNQIDEILSEFENHK